MGACGINSRAWNETWLGLNSKREVFYYKISPIKVPIIVDTIVQIQYTNEKLINSKLIRFCLPLIIFSPCPVQEGDELHLQVW